MTLGVVTCYLLANLTTTDANPILGAFSWPYQPIRDHYRTIDPLPRASSRTGTTSSQGSSGTSASQPRDPVYLHGLKKVIRNLFTAFEFPNQLIYNGFSIDRASLTQALDAYLTLHGHPVSFVTCNGYASMPFSLKAVHQEEPISLHIAHSICPLVSARSNLLDYELHVLRPQQLLLYCYTPIFSLSASGPPTPLRKLIYTTYPHLLVKPHVTQGRSFPIHVDGPSTLSDSYHKSFLPDMSILEGRWAQVFNEPELYEAFQISPSEHQSIIKLAQSFKGTNIGNGLILSMGSANREMQQVIKLDFSKSHTSSRNKKNEHTLLKQQADHFMDRQSALIRLLKRIIRDEDGIRSPKGSSRASSNSRQVDKSITRRMGFITAFIDRSFSRVSELFDMHADAQGRKDVFHPISALYPSFQSTNLSLWIILLWSLRDLVPRSSSSSEECMAIYRRATDVVCNHESIHVKECKSAIAAALKNYDTPHKLAPDHSTFHPFASQPMLPS
ncbi:hypothetical protein BJ684DRAFT_15998 [Piptocephalis cylindrospora]|uniref:Uncharacterized protein n=1 Tax=Piptocephalis cylindrospora TaxID=1907219 RepID=A0A4P9Y457_9FUNG|nr:hypothetical protein BJ684DRAFT_15998 [Piptocephalis cylindrospora]|eukprot:RKP13623.1 hypothetical protein BJ684DRAFT_15998 [Piptocephalis cylindrospora]